MTREQCVESVMRYVKRAFEYDCFEGTINIRGGNIVPVPDCEWVWIEGSIRNDGLHNLYEQSDESLFDETFEGKCWRLAPPASFLSLCDEIARYNEEVDPTTPLSETFGSYSYTRAKNADGTPMTWQSSFGSSLAQWSGKRMVPGVFF